jgi:CelD/BcsL family acetyltransferase involved in cellulose biosynthesis
MNAMTAVHQTCVPSASSEALLVEAIASTAGLQRLHGAWQRLWARLPRTTPFQSPHWLLPWWRHLGQGTLATIAVRSPDDGELVALAPLYIHVQPQTGRRHLFPIGIGTTDHLDLLLRPGWEDAALARIVTHLRERGGWDVLEFPQLRPEAPLLRALLPPGWRREAVQGEPSPLLALRGASALPVPPAMAQNVRTARHRAERAGALAYELADAQRLSDLLHALARLHASRWSERGEPGVLGDAAVRAFHREAAPHLLHAGLLRLHALRLDGEIAAVLYCLADGAGVRERRSYYYVGGFDPGRRALSPGTLLIAQAIEQASGEGAAAFDFLRGAEPYKYRWGARDQATWTLRAWPAEAR